MMKQCVINHVNGGTSLTDESNIHPLPLKNLFRQIGYVYHWHFNAIFNIFQNTNVFKEKFAIDFQILKLHSFNEI